MAMQLEVLSKSKFHRQAHTDSEAVRSVDPWPNWLHCAAMQQVRRKVTQSNPGTSDRKVARKCTGSSAVTKPASRTRAQRHGRP